jgi:RHS repeat-associated protein
MAWEFAAPLPHSATVPTRNMTSDDDNRLLTVNSQSVYSDADGNLTNAPLTNSTFVSYAYDARNRLFNAGGVTNAYDTMNNRIGQINGTNTTIFVVNPNAKLPQVLMRIKNGVTNYYIYGPGLLYQVTETATATNTLTYHYDFRGSTIALSADNGLVTDRIEYSAYGLTTYRAGTNDTPFLFNGRYGVMTDPNGLLYMQARYYNPYLCRFLNPDPTGFKGGLNMFAAFNGNPVSYLDPFGLNAGTTGDSTWTWFGNGLNNTVSGIGQSMGLGLYDAFTGQWSQSQWDQIYNTMYSTATPDNPAATPYIETAFGVSGGAATLAGGVGLWGAAGLPTMSVAVGEGVPFHVAYGVGDVWVNAVGSSFGNMTVSTVFASETAAGSYFTVTGVPILFPTAVTATGLPAWTCITAAGTAFLRGWGY